MTMEGAETRISEMKAGDPAQDGVAAELGQVGAGHHPEGHGDQGGDHGHQQGADDGVGQAAAFHARRGRQFGEEVPVDGGDRP